jgi:hypothetical protein
VLLVGVGHVQQRIASFLLSIFFLEGAGGGESCSPSSTFVLSLASSSVYTHLLRNVAFQSLITALSDFWVCTAENETTSREMFSKKIFHSEIILERREKS